MENLQITLLKTLNFHRFENFHVLINFSITAAKLNSKNRVLNLSFKKQQQKTE
jgi:hypothetical protein